MKNVKVEWCENFIRAAFRKRRCVAMDTRLFWDMAERSGLWERGTYGTPMHEALEKLVKVEAVVEHPVAGIWDTVLRYRFVLK